MAFRPSLARLDRANNSSRQFTSTDGRFNPQHSPQPVARRKLALSRFVRPSRGRNRRRQVERQEPGNDQPSSLRPRLGKRLPLHEPRHFPGHRSRTRMCRPRPAHRLIRHHNPVWEVSRFRDRLTHWPAVSASRLLSSAAFACIVPVAGSTAQGHALGGSPGIGIAGVQTPKCPCSIAAAEAKEPGFSLS